MNARDSWPSEPGEGRSGGGCSSGRRGGCIRSGAAGHSLMSVVLFMLTASIITSCVTAEPCSAPVVLDEPWRDLTRSSARADHCDEISLSQDKWYAFQIDGEAAVVPTSCIKNGLCRADVSLRINLKGQTLPANVGETITAGLCSSDDTGGKHDCCANGSEVKIARCENNVLVYKLSSSFYHCPAAICTIKANETIPPAAIPEKGEDPSHIDIMEDSVPMDSPVEEVSLVPDDMLTNGSIPETTTTVVLQTNADTDDSTKNGTKSNVDDNTDENTTTSTTAMVPQPMKMTPASNQSADSSMEILTTETPLDSSNDTDTTVTNDLDSNQNTTSTTPEDTESPSNGTYTDVQPTDSLNSEPDANSTTNAAPPSNTTSSDSDLTTTNDAVTDATPAHMSQVDGLYPRITTTPDAPDAGVEGNVTDDSAVNTTQSTMAARSDPVTSSADKPTQSVTTTSNTTPPPVVTGKATTTSAPLSSISSDVVDTTESSDPPPSSPAAQTTVQLSPSSLSPPTTALIYTPGPLPTSEDLIIIEWVRLVFGGTHKDKEFANKVYQLLYGFLLRATRELPTKDGTGWTYNMSSYMNPVTHGNTSTYLDFKVRHTAKTELATIFETLDIRKFIAQNSNLTLIAQCRPSMDCQDGTLRAGAQRSSFQENAPVFISVIVICCLCVAVMITGLLFTRFRRRGTWINNEDTENKDLTEATNRNSYLGAKQSPFTDAEITKDETAVDDTAFNDNDNEKAPQNNENNWVIPLDDALNVHIAKDTEDTRL